jgi:hypothetical protein
MRQTVVAAFSFLAFCLPAGFSQTYTGIRAPAPSLTEPVVNQPYSAELVADTVQVLADGTRVTRTLPNLRLYRDSAGRTRTDGPILTNPDTGKEKVVMVVIVDPVAGFQYVLDLRQRIAHRRPLEAPAPPAANSAAEPAQPERPQRTVEPMGSQWIEGVSSEGTRVTMGLAAAAPDAAPQVLSRTEYWLSPDLQVMVLRRQIDPQGGEFRNRLIHILRAEPDLRLFQPPSDYRMVDETSAFGIQP